MPKHSPEENAPVAPVTQRDIAKRLGVHQTAVSFALRNDPQVSPETARKILAAAAEMGYDVERHHAARMMQKQRYGHALLNRVVAILIMPHFITNPYLAEPFIGISEALARERFDLLTVQVAAEETELARYSPSLARGYVDGVLVGYMAERMLSLRDQLDAIPGFRGRPIVTYLDTVPTSSSATPDYALGSYQAVQHLLELGHREMVLFKPINTGHLWTLRLEGVLHALSEQGVAPERALHVLEFGWGWIDPQYRMDHLPPLQKISAPGAGLLYSLPDYLRAHPAVTAIVAWNDPSAINAWRILEQAGWQLPCEISITGFDDTYPMTDSAGRNQLTTVRVPLRRCGEEAAQLLVGQLTGEQREIEHRLLPTELIVRGSTMPRKGPKKA